MDFHDRGRNHDVSCRRRLNQHLACSASPRERERVETMPHMPAISGRRPWRTAAALVALMAVIPAGVKFVSATAPPDGTASAPVDPNALAREVIDNEIQAQLRDQSLWRYREVQEKDGKTKLLEVCQTKLGDINRLVAIDGRPLNTAERRAEDARINALLAHPDKMQKEARKQRNDAQQARDMMKMFPNAFRFRYEGRQGDLVKLSFTPNPKFRPAGHAAQVFYHMSGQLVVNAKQKRLAEISGKLASEVKFGAGMFGHLDKGGTFLVKQEDVGSGHWQVKLLDVQMNGKALFFKNIDVMEKDSYAEFRPITGEITLKKAVELLAVNAGSSNTTQN